MKAAIILICVIVLFLGVATLFKACTGFVSFFDGERQPRMVELIGDYYYNKLDASIWIKEKRTDSYRRVIDNKIDSLAWGKKNIFGYSGKTYFSINLLTGELIYVNTLDNIVFTRGQNESYKRFNDVPAPAIVKTD